MMQGLPVHEWAELDTDKITFSPQLLDYCKVNACGKYNRSWTCPPACGTMEEQKKNILLHRKALVFTTKHELEDSFDYEGMNRGRDLHTNLTIDIGKSFARILEAGGFSVYGAGSCPICSGKDEGACAGNFVARCAFPDPCPHPDEKIGSIEAAGIDVTELSKAAKIAYNNGPNTVTYFSMITYN